MDGKKRMRPGSPVTIYDVARKAKVSITTVSNVINDKHNIPEVTRRKVRDAIRSLDFTPNKIAQRLVTKRTQTIALLIPTMENPLPCRARAPEIRVHRGDLQAIEQVPIEVPRVRRVPE
jgi:hypothetical protein